MSLINIATSIIVQNSLNQFLLQLRDNKNGLRYKGMWGSVGGGLIGTENIRSGALRELKEETGISLIKNLKFITKKIDLYKNHKPQIIYFFYCRVDSNLNVQCNEGQMFKYFKKNEAIRKNIPKILYEVLMILR